MSNLIAANSGWWVYFSDGSRPGRIVAWSELDGYLSPWVVYDDDDRAVQLGDDSGGKIVGPQ